jgi:LysM repeat protein
MNTPNPLVPQGSLERQSKGKSTVRIAIFTIISIHAVFFAGLLMQGCRRDDGKAQLKTADLTSTNQSTLPPIDPGYYPGTQDVAQATPVPAAPTNLAATSVPQPAETAVSTPPPTVLPSEPPVEGKPYKIGKGDTLAKIAKANGISVLALSKANPAVDPSKLRIGQKIQIPASTATAPAGLGFKEPGSTDPGMGTTGVYTVKAGETLSRIAKQHSTTVKAIRAANGLKSDRLLVGQKLKLPSGHSGGTPAPVKAASASKLAATNPSQVRLDPAMPETTNVR